MKILQEFKTFAMRGNVVDMAVGVVVGGAFGKIVGSLVSDILMPPIGLLASDVDFSMLRVVLKDASVDAAGKTVPEVAVAYGAFVTAVVNFLIIAFAIFVVVKVVSYLKRKEQALPPPPAPTEEQVLLTEIRDILKAKV
jgi:large conductance mechanosensitive channel